MTTHAIIANARIGADMLHEQIYAMLGDISPTDDQMQDIVSSIVEKVDAQLPGSLSWYPYLSEVWADVEDESDIDTDDLLEMIGEAAEEATDEWLDANPELTEEVKSLDDIQFEKVRNEEAEKAGNPESIDFLQLVDFQSVRDTAKKYRHSRITIAEMREIWADLFAELVEIVTSEEEEDQ